VVGGAEGGAVISPGPQLKGTTGRGLLLLLLVLILVVVLIVVVVLAALLLPTVLGSRASPTDGW
jgi:hypothetical protein